VVLVTTAPLWVALLSPIFLKDKLTKWILIGVFVSLAGSVIVGLSSNCEIVGIQLTCNNLGFSLHGREFLGDMMALAGAFLSAGYLIVGRKVREKISLQSYIFSVYSTAAIILVMVVLITGEKVVGYTSASYLWLLLLAIVPQVIGHSSFNWALKYLPAAYVAIALLGEPIGTISLTMIFLKESPKLLEILGGIFILAGITLATQLKKGINIQQKTS
jgi:drug/metabolite transporter (DMT)-like permease